MICVQFAVFSVTLIPDTETASLGQKQSLICRDNYPEIQPRHLILIDALIAS